ncbi:MAG TPA: hypothetical protein VF806_07610 [Anaerolineaceae bacterium]
MKSIRLQRVSLSSTFRFGLILGAIVQFLPALLVTFLFFWGVSAAAGWLSGLQSTLPLPGGISLPVNAVDLLGLQGLLSVLEFFAVMAAWQIALYGVAFWLALTLLTGLLSVIVAGVLNVVTLLTGGIDLYIEG